MLLTGTIPIKKEKEKKASPKKKGVVNCESDESSDLDVSVMTKSDKKDPKRAQDERKKEDEFRQAKSAQEKRRQETEAKKAGLQQLITQPSKRAQKVMNDDI